MKLGKFFRVVSAMFAFLLALALLVISLLTILHLFDVNFIESEILDNFFTGVETTTAELKFLDSLETYAPLVFTLIVFLLPALLLLFAGIILMTKMHRSKAKYVFAAILAILGIGVFTGIVELYADNMFGTDLVLIARLAVGAYAALTILFLVLSLLGKKPKKAAAKATTAPAEKQAAAAQEETQVVETPEPLVQTVEPIQTVETASGAEQQNATPAPNTEPAQKVVVATVEPMKTAETYAAETPKEQPKRLVPESPLWDTPFTTPASTQSDPQEYIPDERKRTVSDIVEYTYRKKTDNLSESNVKKLRTLRSLLDSGAISKDEYIALVDRYLQENK